MKALLSKSAGGFDTLVLEEVADPTPQVGEVLVAVKACGVNYPDVLIIEDKYQAKPKRPFAPGSEIAGIVEAVGEGVTRLKVGDRVIGQLAWGGMAEKVAVAETRCLGMPDAMSYEHGAAFVITFGTFAAAREIGGRRQGLRERRSDLGAGRQSQNFRRWVDRRLTSEHPSCYDVSQV
jgi:NADPH2:quinone reductase